jgi:hypothetical protein
MFAITLNTTYAFTDKFKKVGKKVQKQRKGEVEKIKDRLKDIAREEGNRTKEIFKQHRDIFKKKKPTKSTSIDLFEK